MWRNVGARRRTQLGRVDASTATRALLQGAVQVITPVKRHPLGLGGIKVALIGRISALLIKVKLI